MPQASSDLTADEMTLASFNYNVIWRWGLDNNTFLFGTICFSFPARLDKETHLFPCQVRTAENLDANDILLLSAKSCDRWTLLEKVKLWVFFFWIFNVESIQLQLGFYFVGFK